MATLKTLVRRPFVIGVGLVAVALALTLLLPIDSSAEYPCGVKYTYYSNASYATVVGARGYYQKTCGCGYFQWGSTSAYYVTSLLLGECPLPD